jgi:hypothetical protein
MGLTTNRQGTIAFHKATPRDRLFVCSFSEKGATREIRNVAQVDDAVGSMDSHLQSIVLDSQILPLEHLTHGQDSICSFPGRPAGPGPG